MDDKLKHCPFCGREGTIHTAETSKVHGMASGIVHTEIACICGARMLNTEEKEAIAAWNRRAYEQDGEA